ncbi:SDR family oxidoreductase [Cupriavidus sp. CV2]|uniref:SDR family oxidoreductase n=1 Tax=Cupriavidus ulmosensis TaxID=3065913 RepID=UPI00296B101F|nr:SDR family oxidoreductase [Cupriavidus sp. CV2]MDW3682147.1 SDR family oxidoreductase [Cupriavidus sp. CV2]
MPSARRTYVITGAASGIGLATRNLLESEGQQVIGVDLRHADIIADLETTEGRSRMIEQVAKASGGAIDAVLAVAGVDTAGPTTVAVNYYGAIATLAGLRPLLLKSAAPRAVAVSSITSVYPCDQRLLTTMLNGSELHAIRMAESAAHVYATSKRALSQWIRRNAISADWAGSGIPLNAIAPGLVKTELLRRLFEDPDTERTITANCPMPLCGPYEPVDAAELLAWLSSEKNGHMTGQTIFIDGGADAVIRGESTW